MVFLQSYVVAVCLFEKDSDQAQLRALQGTAFFVGNCGLFLTARHVLEQAIDRCKGTDCEVGLVTKGSNGKTAEEVVTPLTTYEYAPPPYDIAIGLAPYKPASPLSLGAIDVSIWQEIATLGYPTSASAKEGNALWMNLRAHRGYVQRTTLPRDIPIGTHPSGIELSFLLGPGMSGAPIFTSLGEVVIGVGVGSFRSEEIEDSFVEVSDEGKEYRELRLRIEQHGFAHAISDLLDWRPEILTGASLLEASQKTT